MGQERDMHGKTNQIGSCFGETICPSFWLQKPHHHCPPHQAFLFFLHNMCWKPEGQEARDAVDKQGPGRAHQEMQDFLNWRWNFRWKPKGSKGFGSQTVSRNLHHPAGANSWGANWGRVFHTLGTLLLKGPLSCVCSSWWLLRGLNPSAPHTGKASMYGGSYVTSQTFTGPPESPGRWNGLGAEDAGSRSSPESPTSPCSTQPLTAVSQGGSPYQVRTHSKAELRTFGCEEHKRGQEVPGRVERSVRCTGLKGFIPLLYDPRQVAQLLESVSLDANQR